MCSGSQCSNHQPSTMTWHGRRLYEKKTGVEPTWRWLSTGKGEGDWEPKVGLSKLFFGLKMTQNVSEFKFRKEISTAHCTLGFIWHPQLKLPLGVFVFTSAKDIIELEIIYSATCSNLLFQLPENSCIESYWEEFLGWHLFTKKGLCPPALGYWNKW